MAELRTAFDACSTNSITPSRASGNRTDEVVIGGFGLKSKDGAIRIVEKAIAGNDDNPIIMKDQVSMVPEVIPVRLDSRTHAETFVRRYDLEKATKKTV